MSKTEDYLKEMKKLWLRETEKPGRWHPFYLTPKQRETVLRELLLPLASHARTGHPGR